jgi:NAD-dependent dihydropyrimidine dehydrogenase PreA subunit
MNHRYIAGVTTLKLTVEKCTGCGRCVEVCPHAVFVIRDHRVQIAAFDNCMECGACAQNCAYDAIYVKNGVGCAVAMINGIMKKGDPDKGTCDCGGDAGSCC